MRQSHDAGIGQVLTFYKTNSAKFRELCQMTNARICQARTTSQVNVPNPIASLDQLNDGIISQVYAMAQMNIMEILGQFADGRNCTIGNVSTFREHQVS